MQLVHREQTGEANESTTAEGRTSLRKRAPGTLLRHRRSLRAQLAEADAFVVVTPEYNHGYPAALKELIDSAGEEWHAKPVAFVSYGGVSGGLRAVEQLRQVFAELHVVSIRDSVSFQNAWQLFDATGCPAEPDRCSAQMSRMLAKLHWWATALRTARTSAPYSAAA
jgi:NAD(P)H-dependent FMN reductase